LTAGGVSLIVRSARPSAASGGETPERLHPANLRAIVGSTAEQVFDRYMVGPRAASAGKPGKACTPVDCDLPFGFQLPRPLMDLSVSDFGCISEQYIAIRQVAEVWEKAAVGS
jgi:hypothetical protein